MNIINFIETTPISFKKNINNEFIEAKKEIDNVDFEKQKHQIRLLIQNIIDLKN